MARSRKRYQSYLHGSTSDRQPARMGALAVTSSAAPGASARGGRQLSLERWELLLWRNRHGRAGRIDRYSGTGRESWWGLLTGLLSRPGRVVLLCPHAQQSLALLGVWDAVDRGDVILHPSPLLLSDPPTAVSISLRGERGTLTIYDTRNYGVDTSAQGLGIVATAQLAIDMIEACQRWGLGTLQPTASAQALYAWRRSYLPAGCMVHTDKTALALERAALHGGRAECYRLGRIEGPIYHLDVSGYYPSILTYLDVPIRLRHSSETWEPYGPELLRQRTPMIAHVKVRTEEPHLPAVRDGLTVYPVGTWWTTLAGPELQAAHDAGEILTGSAWASYDVGPALYEYARMTLLLRQQATEESNPNIARWAKGLGVGIVGKLAQRSRIWEERPGADLPGRWGHWPYVDAAGNCWSYRAVGGLVQREVVAGETATSCPAIPAFVWAEGRQRLWDYQLVAGRDEVYYCHTDSLFVSGIGFARLRQAGLLGRGEPGLLRQKDLWPWIEILGISHYRVPGRTVCAGVVGSGGLGGADAETGWLDETSRQALGQYRPPRPVQYRAPGEYISPYRHGVRGPDGRVSPWRMGE